MNQRANNDLSADGAPPPMEPEGGVRGLMVQFSNRLSLSTRILLVNLLGIMLLTGGVIFLDNYRERLFDERMDSAGDSAAMIAQMADLDPPALKKLLASEAQIFGSRIRLYSADGALDFDSSVAFGPAYDLRAQEDEGLLKLAAGWLDQFVDLLLLKNLPPPYAEPAVDRAENWPVLSQLTKGERDSRMYNAGDYTPVILGAARSADGSIRVLVSRNPRDVRRIVRAQRLYIFAFGFAGVLLMIALSRFLAATIARPLKVLSDAAIQVRRGGERDVSVPRMPGRKDKIGILANTLADMTESLRHRIDATESFAADVAHEIKNPIASLRSALEGLRSIKDPNLQAQLFAIAEDDVHRMDRLISDILDVSRVDSELTRTRFVPVDIGDMIEQLVAARDSRSGSYMKQQNISIAFARPRKKTAIVMGEGQRLARMLDNLIDNAISFSPAGGLVEIFVTMRDDKVLIRVRDEGPGVQEQERSAIFHRFYSNRPMNESPNAPRHSGLGLAIVRTIAEGHGGSVTVEGREDGRLGAVFGICLPLAPVAMVE